MVNAPLHIRSPTPASKILTRHHSLGPNLALSRKSGNRIPNEISNIVVSHLYNLHGATRGLDAKSAGAVRCKLAVLTASADSPGAAACGCVSWFEGVWEGDETDRKCCGRVARSR